MIFRGVGWGDKTTLIIEFKLWKNMYFYRTITGKCQHWAWDYLMVAEHETTSLSRSSLLCNQIWTHSFRLSWNPLSLRDCRI